MIDGETMTNREYMEAAADMAALSAGMMREYIGAEFSVGSKQGRHDYVTEVDVRSEKLIRGEIALRFPHHKCFGEEEASEDAEKAARALASFGPEDMVWFVDPLDGTGNFVRGMPLFCISIGLARGGELIAGVVLDPSRGELFSAAKGEGAWLNGERMRVSETASLGDAVVTTSVPIETSPSREVALRDLYRLLPQVSSARVFNCAALCLAYAAAGRTDGHWEYGINVWDMAAGALLVTEAGGRVSAADGGEFSIHSKNIIAGNAPVHAALASDLTAAR